MTKFELNKEKEKNIAFIENCGMKIIAISYKVRYDKTISHEERKCLYYDIYNKANDISKTAFRLSEIENKLETGDGIEENPFAIFGHTK